MVGSKQVLVLFNLAQQYQTQTTFDQVRNIKKGGGVDKDLTKMSLAISFQGEWAGLVGLECAGLNKVNRSGQ